MKKFVIGCGNGLIDFCAGLFIVLIVIGACAAFSENIATGFGVLIGGLIFFIIAFYFIYLLMDINDSLKIIAKNTEYKSNEADKQ